MKNDVVERSKVVPHFSNINADSILTGSLKYLIELNAKKPKLIVGASDKSEIQLYGLGILERHATISLEDGKLHIEPIESGRIVRNGKPEEKKIKMENLDRYVFGASLYFLYVNPAEFTINGETSVNAMTAQVNAVTFASFQQEIAKESGLITESDVHERSADEIECLNELIDLIPHIEEANQMSIILDKKIKYSAIILNPLSVGNPNDKATVGALLKPLMAIVYFYFCIHKFQPVITVKKFGTSLEWIWEKYKFIDRKSLMSEMYLDIKEDGKVRLLK
jgi:kinesin family protein 1